MSGIPPWAPGTAATGGVPPGKLSVWKNCLKNRRLSSLRELQREFRASFEIGRIWDAF